MVMMTIVVQLMLMMLLQLLLLLLLWYDMFRHDFVHGVANVVANVVAVVFDKLQSLTSYAWRRWQVVVVHQIPAASFVSVAADHPLINNRSVLYVCWSIYDRKQFEQQQQLTWAGSE
jgi:hypothetical protein